MEKEKCIGATTPNISAHFKITRKRVLEKCSLVIHLIIKEFEKMIYKKMKKDITNL